MSTFGAERLRASLPNNHTLLTDEYLNGSEDGRDFEQYYMPPTVEANTYLCEACRRCLSFVSVQLHNRTSNYELSEGRDLYPDYPGPAKHHSGFESLFRFVRSRCHLCLQLMSFLGHNEIREGLDLDTVAWLHISLQWSDNLLREPDPNGWDISFLGEVPFGNTIFEWTILDLKLWPSDHYSYAFTDHLTHDCTGTVAGRDTAQLSRRNDLFDWQRALTDSIHFLSPLTSMSSQSSRTLAMSWLSRCCKDADGSHGQCNAGVGEWLPTRLLDVCAFTSSGSLRLASTQTDSGDFADNTQYITLSHRWGSWGTSGIPVLTQANQADRYSVGIASQELPKTFRDAVEVCSWFNVRWLWIDSLCIVQQSPEDWEREAASMTKVYRHSLLNISAEAAEDARGGCLQERDPLMVSPWKLTFNDHAKSWWVTPGTQNMFGWISKGPLSQRGWVYQERMLARRVLHFTRYEVVWECCSQSQCIASETFPHGYPGGWPYATLREQKYQVDKAWNGAEDDKAAICHLWKTLCQSYSSKPLTNPNDKLVALSGLAKEFEAKLEDRYVAGMWSSTLMSDLLWQVGTHSTPVAASSRPAQYRAPSWSWLAIDRPIDHRLYEHRVHHPLVDILDVTVEPATSDATGLIKSASLTVRGLLRRIMLRRYTHYRNAVCKFTSGSETTLLIDPKGADVEAHTNSVFLAERRRHLFWSLDAEKSGDDYEQHSIDADDDSAAENSDDESRYSDSTPIRYEVVVSGYFLLIAVRGRGQSERPERFGHAPAANNNVFEGLLLRKAYGAEHYERIGKLEIDGEVALRIQYRPQYSSSNNEDAWRSLRKAHKLRWVRTKTASESVSEPSSSSTTEAESDTDSTVAWEDQEDLDGREDESRASSVCNDVCHGLTADVFGDDEGLDLTGFERVSPQTITIV